MQSAFDVSPARVADWIHARLIGLDFPRAEFDRRLIAIGLELSFNEIVPDAVFHALRFDLMVEDRHLTFEVADALISNGAKPCCRLLLRPARATGDCHACNFMLLAEEAEKHAGSDRRRQDWRDRVTHVRYYHPLRPAQARSMPNPRHEPTIVVAASDVWNVVPAHLQARDVSSLEEYLAGVDQAFADFS